MAFLMFLLLAIFVIIAYFSGKKDLLSPWFLLCLMLFATFTIVLCNYTNWEVKINGLFVLYVVTAIIAFGLGGLLVRSLSPARSANKQTARLSVNDANVQRRYPVYILLIVSVGFAAIYIYKLLSDVSGAGSFSDKLRTIYQNIVYNDYTPGFLFNQMREVITAIAYVNTFRLMIRLFSGKNKDSMSITALLIPIVVFVAMVLVTSDRNIFIRYAFYFICLYVLFFRENCKKRNVNLRIIQKVVILGIILLLIFFLLGKLKQYSSGLTRVIGIYGGSGLYDFNLWIKDFKGPFLNGNATFTALLGSLKTIFGYVGIDLDVQTLNRFDAFIEYKSANGYIYSSNIYSAMKPFVEDFGYFGVILFPFIIGAFYQWLFNKMKKRKYGFGWVVYSMRIYPVLFFPIAEQLFGRFTLGFVYELFWLSVLYFAIFGKKKRRSVARQSAKVTGVLNEG